MKVRPQVVDPELFRRCFSIGGGFSVEQEDVRLHTLRVEDAGGQAQEGLDVGLLKQLTADRFASAAFEKHVIRHDSRRAAMLA